MKYIIIGSGPTGLSLAYVLAKKGYSVHLFEKNNQLGGSWNAQWDNNAYFTENAPRVLFYKGYTKELLDDLNMKYEVDIAPIYGTFLESNAKFLKFFYSHFTFRDYFLFFNAIVKYKMVKEPTMNMQTWIDHETSLSVSAKKAVAILCVTTADRPDKTNVNDFFGSIGLINIITQFRDPNQWHRIIEARIGILPNVHIHKNTEVVSILHEGNNTQAHGIITRNMKTYYGDRIVLCTQSNGILSILRNSTSPMVKNNWKSYEWIEKWSRETYYSAFSFQLHFDVNVPFPENWCWSCGGDWNIIILPVSDWLKVASKDPKVKTVWSCCIVDMDTKSKKIGKTVNECDVEEIIKESLRQLGNIQSPYHVTISPGLQREKQKWVSRNTGFTSSIYGYLPMKGKLDNVFALGCFTERNKNEISYMETALEASIEFLNTYH